MTLLAQHEDILRTFILLFHISTLFRENPSSQQQQQQEMSSEVTRLPSYFPTYPPECRDVAKEFFECFETHAVMKDEKDTSTCRTALSFCQDSVKAYMKCVDDKTAPKKSSSWF